MTAAQPEPPASAPDDDSMLTRKFGKEVVNYYAGGRLNRFSFLRSDAAFLARAATSPRARYIALNGLNPLVAAGKAQLACLPLEEVQPLIGEQPFPLSEEEATTRFDSTKISPLVVFLGVLEDALSEEIASTDHGVVKGQPFFAVDVTPRGSYKDAAEAFIQGQAEKGHEVDTNPRGMALDRDSASMYAQSRSLMDWNSRNPFCAGCGNLNLPVHAGYKRVCPPTDIQGGAEPQERSDCPTRHGLSNVWFPRTDAAMIAAIVSADGQRVLLGRQKRWPPHFFSTLAGFLEPGESIEEAVRREAWEESGVRVGRVVIHSTQPWPYPGSLMIGAIAQVLPGDGEVLNLNDKELEAARWFTLDELRAALATGVGPLGDAPPEGYKEGGLRLPPSQAIANRLLTSVVEGYLTGGPKM